MFIIKKNDCVLRERYFPYLAPILKKIYIYKQIACKSSTQVFFIQLEYFF